jgi:hypothetical protein
VGSLLLVVPASVWLAWSTSDLNFRLLYRAPKLLDDGLAVLFLIAGAALLLGMLLAGSYRPTRWADPWPGLDDRQLDVLQKSAGVCFWLTIVGYTAFAVAGIARGATPALLLQTLLTQDTFGGEVEELFAPVTGITTLTQVGVAYVVLAGLLWISGRRQVVWRRMALVVGLAVVRGFFLTERLAIIEIAVPLLLLLAVQRQRLGDVRAALAPVAALPLLVVVFGLFEYSRSWTFFRDRTTATYPEFVLDRLAGYYATAYNNGAAQIQDGGFSGRLPYFVLEAFWTAPGVGSLGLYDRLAGGSAVDAYAEVLEQRANPEFNNPCGLCSPLVDLGTSGGLLWLLVAGVLVGLCWSGFRTGAPWALVSYPVVFLGLLELPRYLYWTQGRLVPAAVALAIVAFLLSRRPRTPWTPPPSLAELPAVGAGRAPDP